jgi:3-oxoacid CoA-transferase subunit A
MNFNPLAAMAGRLTIAQVERLVEPGDIGPAQVHLPGIFVQRIVETGLQHTAIEKRTTHEMDRART